MPDSFVLQYDLHEHGWATARLFHGDVSVDMTASYLRDSLRELALAAYAISRGPGTSRVIFMDEPGEHQLTLTRDIGVADCRYELVWFDDWEIWGMHHLPGSQFVCAGTVPVRRLVQQVYTLLWNLYETYGEAGYEVRWCSHEFPTEPMQRLIGAPRPG
jgi:hypothetical protein